MRRFLLAALMFGAGSCAQAADMPDFLRGSFAPSTPSRNWDGWYVGGQVDYSSTANDFGGSLAGLTNYIYRNSVLEAPTGQLSALGKSNAQGTGFGAFVGRNWQWEDVVFGVEANYNFLDRVSASSASSIGPLQYAFPAGQFTAADDTPSFTVTLNGKASAQIKDAITFRGRAGWAAGDFLPYVFGGLAVGRLDVARTVTSNTTRTDTFVDTINGIQTTTVTGPNLVASQSLTMTQERTDDFAFGWTAGLGLEYAVWNGLFVRGEWEHIQFLSVMSTNISVNSTRVGIGYKF